MTMVRAALQALLLSVLVAVLAAAQVESLSSIQEAISLLDLGNPQTVPSDAPSPYLLQLRATATQEDIAYLTVLITECATKIDTEASGKSAFGVYAAHLHVATASLTKKCLEKVIYNDGFGASLVHLAEADGIVETALPVNPTDGDPKPNWNLVQVVDTAFMPDLADYAAPTTITAGGGTGVNVYVVGSGVHRNTLELEAAVAEGFSIATPSICTQCGDASGRKACDVDGTGTAAASIVRGKTLGLARGSYIIPVRTRTCEQLHFASGIVQGLNDVIKAVETAPANETKPSIALLTFSVPRSEILNKAVARAIDAGITVVAAAGDMRADSCATSPASAVEIAPDLIVVAPTNIHNKVSNTTTNTGKCVTMLAPGAQIAVADKEGAAQGTGTYKSGSHLAAAHAAAVAAVFLGNAPKARPHAVRQYLLGTAQHGKVGTADIPSFLGLPSVYRSTTQAATVEPCQSTYVDAETKASKCGLHGTVTLKSESTIASPSCMCKCRDGYTGALCTAAPAVARGHDLLNTSVSGPVEALGYPLNGRAVVQRFQALYTAAELTAAGVPANQAITSLSMRVFHAPARTLTDVVLAVGFLPAAFTTLSGFVPTTVVFRGDLPASLALPETNVTFPFFSVSHPGASPIVWDGVSSLVVEYASAFKPLASYLAGDKRAISATAGAVYLAAPHTGHGRAVYAYSETADAYPFRNSLQPKFVRSARLVPQIRVETVDVASKCAKVACGNRGFCAVTGTGESATAACQCPAGWSGPECLTQDAGLCSANRCGAHGYCESGVCVCRNGYSGTDCAVAPVSACAAAPPTCQQGGTCNAASTDLGAQCLCPAGKFGYDCSQQKQACTTITDWNVLFPQAKSVCHADNSRPLSSFACAIFGPNALEPASSNLGFEQSDACRHAVVQLLGCLNATLASFPSLPPADWQEVESLEAARMRFTAAPAMMSGKLTPALAPNNGSLTQCVNTLTHGGITTIPLSKTDINITGVVAGSVALVREGLPCSDASAKITALVPEVGKTNVALLPNVSMPMGAEGPYSVCYSVRTGNDAAYVLQGGQTVTVDPNQGKVISLIQTLKPKSVPAGGRLVELTLQYAAPLEALLHRQFAFVLDKGHCNILAQHVATGITVPARSNAQAELSVNVTSFLEVDAQAGAQAGAGADATLSRATILTNFQFGFKGTVFLCIKEDAGDRWSLVTNSGGCMIEVGLGPDAKPTTDLCAANPCGLNQKCVKAPLGAKYSAYPGICVCTNGFRGSQCQQPPLEIQSGHARVSIKLKLDMFQAAGLEVSDTGAPSLALDTLTSELARFANVAKARLTAVSATMAAADSLLEIASQVVTVPADVATLDASAEAEADTEEDAEEDASSVLPSSAVISAAMRRIRGRAAAASSGERAVFDDGRQSYSFAQLSARVAAQADSGLNDVRVVYDIAPNSTESNSEAVAKDIAARLGKPASVSAVASMQYLQHASSAQEVCADGTDPAVNNCGNYDWCEKNVMMSCVWFGVLIGSCVLLLSSLLIYFLCFRSNDDDWRPEALGRRPGAASGSASSSLAAGARAGPAGVADEDTPQSTQETRPLVAGGWDSEYKPEMGRRGAAQGPRHQPSRHS